MVDMTTTILAKSDQLNADDLLGRTLTVTVTNVSLLAGEQPISINYEGDNGKPFRPCKSMRRVLVNVWGSDGTKYIGKRMTLFRDEKVSFGGAAVGGTRISHMSGIDKPVTMSLTAAKNSKKPYTVKPLEGHAPIAEPIKEEPVNTEQLLTDGKAAANLGSGELGKWWKSLGGAKQKLLVAELPALKARAADVDALSSNDEEIPL